MARRTRTEARTETMRRKAIRQAKYGTAGDPGKASPAPLVIRKAA